MRLVWILNAYSSNHELDLDLARFRETQGQRDLVAFLEGLLDVDEHEVRAGGRQLEAAVCRDVVALYGAHAYDLPVFHRDVSLHFCGERGARADQAIGRGRFVADQHVAGGDLGAGGGDAGPGVLDFDLRPGWNREKNKAENREQSHEAFLFSSSCSLRPRILPVS